MARPEKKPGVWSHEPLDPSYALDPHGLPRDIAATLFAGREATVFIVKTFAFFVLTAFAEILGCYLPYLWLRKGGSAWLLLPATGFLLLFAWLLSLHPTAAGRVYAGTAASM